MAAAKRATFTVNVSNLANLAAVETAIATAIGAQAAGFLPEQVSFNRCVFTGGRADLLTFTTGKAPYQDWLAVTAATVNVLELEGLANAAAVDAAVDALCTTQEGLGKALRCQCYATLEIGGASKDCLVLLFTDGAPAIS